MKDLAVVKQILRMKIKRKDGILTLSQEEYVKKVLNRFHLASGKLMSTPLAYHFKLSKEHSLTTKQERDHIAKVPYTSPIGSLMYVIGCKRVDITHAVGVVSKYMSNQGK